MTVQRSMLSQTDCFHKRSAGFTLVELLITLVLGLLLIGGVTLLFISGRVAVIDTERLSRAQENLRFVGNFLVQDLRMTGYRVPTNFVEQNNGSELVIRYVAPNDCLGNSTVPGETEAGVLEVFSNPLLSGIAQNRYFVRDGRLFCEDQNRMIEGPLVEGVRSIEFNLWPDSLRPLGVDLSVEWEGPGGDSISYLIRVAFRNRVLRALYLD